MPQPKRRESERTAGDSDLARRVSAIEQKLRRAGRVATVCAIATAVFGGGGIVGLLRWYDDHSNADAKYEHKFKQFADWLELRTRHDLAPDELAKQLGEFEIIHAALEQEGGQLGKKVQAARWWVEQPFRR